MLRTFTRFLTLSAITLLCATARAEKPRKANARIVDKGDFKAVYYKTKSPKYAKLQQMVRGARVLEQIAEGLNDIFALPADVRLTFIEGETPNAFYDPQSRQIAITYEFLVDANTRLQELFKTYAPGENASPYAVGAMTFALFHEVGHALVHVLKLPAIAREEDDVDELSALLLMSVGPYGAQATVGGALYLATLHDTPADVAGAHSLAEERFYNVMTLVYGSNARAFSNWVKDGFVPKQRAKGARQEWERARKRWKRMLRPSLKVAAF